MHDPNTSPDNADRLPKGPRDRLEDAMDKLHGSRNPDASRFLEAGPEDLDPPDDGPDGGPTPGFDKAPFEDVEELEGVGELFTF